MISPVLSAAGAEFLRALVIGLIEGSVVAIGAIGLTLSYGVTRFINFAYGEFLTYGAFFALFLTGYGIGVPLAALAAMVVIGVLGVGLSNVFFKPIEDAGPFALLMTSIGLEFTMRYSLAIVAPETGNSFPIPVTRSWEIFGFFLSPVRVVILLVSVVTVVGIFMLLKYTTLGKKMRAYSGNKELSRISGIDTDAVVRRTWLLSAAIGALAGVLLGLFSSPFGIRMGFEMMLLLFAAVIAGGIGKPQGALIGAILVGLMMSFGTTYISPNYTLEYAFVILLAVLLIKPDGIAGGEI